MSLHERDLSILVATFPSRARDFLLVQSQQDGALRAIHPLEILALQRTAKTIENVAQKQAPLALILALCRLLVPCLQYRGSGRHLVVEPWSQADLRGETIPADVRTIFAIELSTEQAEDYRAVTTGESPPDGSLPEMFWTTQSNLPLLPPEFDDPDLGHLAKSLYFHLVPDGNGLIEVDVTATTAKIEACRAEGFASLNLDMPPRKLQPTFRKLLAVTVRYASQMTGAVVEDLVRQHLCAAGRLKLTSPEREMLALRYGACPALSDVNVGFLFGCGPMLADLVNEYFLTVAGIRPETDRLQAEELLRAFVYLLGSFQRRRKLARAQERREDRQRHADRMPVGPRHQAEFQQDHSVPPPETQAAISEELARLKELLPLLKDRDAERLQTFIDCNGDRKAAAAKLELDPTVFSRQLRQTVFPAVRRLARDEGLQG